VGAYVMPDGAWVSIDRYGTMTPRIKPFDFDAPLEAPELADDPFPATTVDATTADATPGATTPTREAQAGMPKAPPAAVPMNTAAIPVTASP